MRWAEATMTSTPEAFEEPTITRRDALAGKSLA